ncbi:MAG: MFS transporter [Thermoplasmata archaeon YP2-bin.285]|uniref:MFS transporter n=1 Tax=Candidatus Sysuiplasma superficiale TaxID=2823368 RepID=A0A8J7YP39_9ARCH|nr:MFS transporter [Candidatus Sysuiplasma superficiale]
MHGRQHMDASAEFRKKVGVLATTSIAHFLNDGESAIFPVLIPPLTYYVSGNFELAIVVTCFYLFSSFASPFAVSGVRNRGNMERGMGEGLTILGGGIASMGVFIALIHSFGVAAYIGIVASAAIAGFGSSYYHPIGSGIVQSAFPEESIGFALGVNGSAGSIGRSLFLTISVLSFILEKLSGGLIVLGVACIAASLPMEIVYHGRTARTGAHDTAQRAGFADAARVITRIWPLIVMTVVRNVEATGILLYLPTYFIRNGILHYGLNLGLSMTVIMALPVGGQVIIGLISDRLGRVRTVFLTTFFSGFFVLLFLAYPYNIYFDIATLGMFSLSSFSGFPILFPIATHMVPGKDSYLSSSMAWMAVGLGSAISPLAVVALSQRYALGNLYYTFMLLAAATLAVSFLSFTRHIISAERASA